MKQLPAFRVSGSENLYTNIADTVIYKPYALQQQLHVQMQKHSSYPSIMVTLYAGEHHETGAPSTAVGAILRWGRGTNPAPAGAPRAWHLFVCLLFHLCLRAFNLPRLGDRHYSVVTPQQAYTPQSLLVLLADGVSMQEDQEEARRLQEQADQALGVQREQLLVGIFSFALSVPF